MLDLDPGPYGFYIWMSYGLSAAALAWLAISSLAFARRWRRRAETLEARAREVEPGPDGQP
ncbi:MAG: heme exporter protein CcmD [Phenylobacterium sp.]|jgi:heme exporter protein D|uniref:heme exporter protein CcmD n=1 Tax=Phenylobacterium sp. TaxID=1871053 RepID=UPI0025D400D8|nr:heme exporter protein CcmD [Phenylobacterium sp.]MCA6299107.1 heme exporter protein CcmD [Phenylobacterium sp.]